MWKMREQTPWLVEVSMHIGRLNRMFSMLVFGGACVGLACGGSAPTAKATPGSSIKSVDGLLESVENLQTSGSFSTALVQFAFLYPDAAPADRAAKRRAMLQLKDWKRIGNKLVFVSATVEEGLPMSLSSLAQTMSYAPRLGKPSPFSWSVIWDLPCLKARTLRAS
jgi:hypothetical protein